jgi:hypothetical protein
MDSTTGNANALIGWRAQRLHNSQGFMSACNSGGCDRSRANSVVHASTGSDEIERELTWLELAIVSVIYVAFGDSVEHGTP